MTKGKLVIIYARRSSAACEMCETSYYFPTNKRKLINFFKGELAVYAWPVSSNDINKIHRGRVKRSMVQNTIIFCVKQVILFNGLTPNLLQKRNVKARLEAKFN